MIRVDVIRMAGDAGFTTQEIQSLMGQLERLVDMSQAAEREACAKVCDGKAEEIRLFCNEAHVVACASSIRARSAK